MKRGKIIVKQSLSDAYRQYLEDVTIPMNTFLDAPEEFVTTKPSIYHSLRMQPATDARTGRVRNSPAKARALASIDNLQFQDDIKNFSLPLSTNQGLPLYGRHVYPGELYSFNPSFREKHLPDLPVSYKQTWGDGTKNRPLNLYGFTGNAPTPQRFTNQTLQPEGIIYGNLDENDVIQLNTRPASANRFAQVARALSPFHPSRDVKDLSVHSEDLARDIMDAGIPPILAESNVGTRGRIHHLPFRLDEPIDVQEAHDPFAQYDMGNLNRPTPQGLEQFTLDAIRAGEPMDLSWRLLKEEIPYSSRDYPPQEISISTGNPLVTPKIAGETPEVCNMPGCESGLPPVMYRRMANPIRSIDNHEFMCEQCAYKHDLQSLLFDKMIKGEITPMEYAMQLLKQEPLQLRNSAELAELARQGDTEAYNEMMERTGDYYLANEITGEPDMEANLEAYGAETGKNPFKTPPIGRTNQIQIHQPPVTPIHADKKLHNWQYKNASEPMDIAMQLLKRELHPGRDIEGYLNADGHYAGEEELYNLNDPEVQNFVNRMHLDKQPPEHLVPETLGMDLGYVEPELRVENRDTKLYHPMMMDEHENLDKFPDRKIVEREGGTKEELVSTSDPTSDVVGVGRTGRTLVSPKPTFQGIPFSEETGFTRSEPMEIAMQLLKEARPHALMSHEELNSKLKEKRNMFKVVSDDPSNEYAELMREVILREGEKVRFPIPKIEIKDDGTEHITYPYADSTGMTFDTNFQDINTGEPMEIAMRLLKMPIVSDSPEVIQLDSGPAHIHQFQDPITGEVKPLYISPASNPNSENLYAGIVGDNGDRASAKFNTGGSDYASLDGVETQEPYRRRGYMSAIYDAMDEYLEQNKKGRHLVASDFQSDEGKAFWESRKKSEPMKIAMQLLKERVSPEAKRHKLEYDKKYESSPERVKYREELNRERRRRHIMGRGGPDMSHTKDHTIVPESPHTNRARHFKDKGTLL